jgi:hypothetical protein
MPTTPENLKTSTRPVKSIITSSGCLAGRHLTRNLRTEPPSIHSHFSSNFVEIDYNLSRNPAADTPQVSPNPRSQDFPKTSTQTRQVNKIQDLRTPQSVPARSKSDSAHQESSSHRHYPAPSAFIGIHLRLKKSGGRTAKSSSHRHKRQNSTPPSRGGLLGEDQDPTVLANPGPA